MKRILLLAALVLLLSTGLAQAQFVLITIDLNNFGLGQIPPGGDPQNPGQPGKPGQQPQQPQPPQQPGQTQEGQPASTPGMIAHAIIEAKKPFKFLTPPNEEQPRYLELTHKWGVSYIPLTVVKPIQTSSISGRLAQVKKEQGAGWMKSPDKLLYVAEWALKRGQVGEYVKLMKELEKVDAKLPQVTNFKRIHSLLQNVPKVDDPRAAAIIRSLENEDFKAIYSKPGHYTLMTQLRADDPAVANRLQLLESTYQSFFYWFALKGKVLTPPPHRLVAVLESKLERFKEKHDLFVDKHPLVGDGFLSRRDHTIIFANKRLDGLYTRLERDNQNYWQSLKVRGDVVLAGGPLQIQNQNDIPVLQTLALVQKALEEEGERATATHEAVRQLLAATGLVPHNVQAGEWLQFGIASFFETPHHALFQGVALPNWTHLVNFKHLRQKGKLPEQQARQILYNVISDGYFRQACPNEQLARESRDLKNPLPVQAAEELELARATSWALCYYLMNRRLDGMLTCLEQLRGLPRDVEHNDAVLAGCFARAFQLSPSPLAHPNAIDWKSFDQLASDWLRVMSNEQLDVSGLEEQILRSRQQANMPPEGKDGTTPPPRQ